MDYRERRQGIEQCKEIAIGTTAGSEAGGYLSE